MMGAGGVAPGSPTTSKPLSIQLKDLQFKRETFFLTRKRQTNELLKQTLY